MDRRRFLRSAAVAAAVLTTTQLRGAPVEYKLGKLPAQEHAYKLKLTDYTSTALPKAPPPFGHYKVVPSAWGMFANDKYGDCVWAGAAHEHMLWTSQVGCEALFTDENVLAGYSAV